MTVGEWAAGARIAFTFGQPVAVAHAWGRVEAAGEGGLSKRVEVRLKNLGPGAPEFGFTLVEPFKSTAWEVSCE